MLLDLFENLYVIFEVMNYYLIKKKNYIFYYKIFVYNFYIYIVLGFFEIK